MNQVVHLHRVFQRQLLGHVVREAADDQGAGVLGILDTTTNSILMPIAAILTCVFIGYVISVKTVSDEVKEDGCEFKFERPFEYMIKYICPICLAAILVFGLLDMFGIFSVY